MSSGTIPETHTTVKLAKVFSIVLHPALVPVWTMFALMCHGVLLPAAVVSAKVYFTLVIALNIVVVPGVFAFLFERVSFWRENPNVDFRRRVLPMVVMIICYGACMLMIGKMPFAYPIRKMLTAGIGCLVLGLGTTPFIKLSMHMVAQGAAVAFLSVAQLSGGGGMLPLLCMAIALASVLASARLYMGVENARQVGFGFAGGFAVTLPAIFFI